MDGGDEENSARRHLTTRGEDVVAFLRTRGKRVISFAGFGELGYRDPDAVCEIVDRVLTDRRPDSVLVNCGTLLRQDGLPGIADVYPRARALGIETAGIHPGIALRHTATHRVSPMADHVFFVDDASWGGLLADGTPSPTLGTILAVTDELVMIGGGRHAADELLAFLTTDIPVEYHEAEMNPEWTAAWCERAGVEIDDPWGAARHVWEARSCVRAGRPWPAR